MKNKYTIILIILCLLSSCFYINNTSYNNLKSNFSINASKIDNSKNKYLYIKEDNNYEKNFEDKYTINIDKTENKIQNNINLININTADKETLKTLPGIGDGIAENIIQYRENVSLFYNVSDIKNVDRIGDKTYEKIKNLITVD